MTTAASAGVVTVCQCNIFDGGRWTDQDQSVVTYDTARRFCEWVATVNPPGSAQPPIAVIGMQELIAETDRAKIESLLEQYTQAPWASARTAQGVNGGSGIGVFWRTDIVESRPDWDLGQTTLDTLDNGYLIKFSGRLFRKVDTDEAFGLFTGKLAWNDAVIGGHAITAEERRLEAVRLKEWIVSGAAGAPGMSGLPGTARVVTTDLNTDTGTPAWQEMTLDFSDPSSQHTHSSFAGATLMDLFGHRYDYVWWDYDSHARQPGGFAAGPQRSSHFGSDHRAVYATVQVHAVDLTPPTASVTEPASGTLAAGTVRVRAEAADESGILQVQFFVDGQSAWTDTAPPYEFELNTAGLTTGTHTITAVATDASSNRLKGTSLPVYIWTGPAGSQPRIGNTKAQSDGSGAVLFGKTVTAAFGNYFYIEEPDRSAGIKVSNWTAPPAGSVVTVAGRMTTLNGEREISASSVVVTGTAAMPQPLSMNSRDLGGGAVSNATPGVANGTGLNNVGLLVECSGKVTAVVPGFYVYIDDGTGMRDGYGYTGVRLDVSALQGWNAPPSGRFIRATGISSTSMIAGKVQRRIKVRSSSDITIGI